MSSSSETYRTLSGSGQAEQRIQRSRFLGFAAPAANAAAAREFVAELRRAHHDARHVCHAWRLGPPDAPEEARTDDGEPAGTGGEPILAALRGAGLVFVVAAVVRYFGGVKLGTGGLTRAYGGVAAAALATAPARTVALGWTLVVEFTYDQQKTVQHLLAAHRGLVVAEHYAAAVRWEAWLPLASCDGFRDALREATAGRVGAEYRGTVPVPSPREP